MKFESQLQIVTAAGVPPLTVNQNALVTNFNADLLDGQHASYFLDTSSTAQTKSGSLYLGSTLQAGFGRLKVFDYSLNNTPTNGIRIATTIPQTSGVGMYTLIFEGYRYGDSAPEMWAISFYPYNTGSGVVFINYGGSCHGGKYPTSVQLGWVGGFANIFILSDLVYYRRFAIRAVAGNMSESTSHFEGWVVSDSNPTLAGATGVVTVPFNNEFGNVAVKGALSITSTALVSNLNADYLDGQHGSYYENRDATAVGFSAGTLTLTRAAGNLTVSLDGRYLPLTGGTVTGQLAINGTTASDILRLYTTGSTIWKFGVTDASGSYLNITADFGNVTIYKLNGNITTPGAFVSTVATGTAPLSVTSTTAVTNLNSDLLDGQHASYFENRDITAVSFASGSLTFTRAAGNLSISMDGRYVPISGGTMTGSLIVQGGNASITASHSGNAAQWYGKVATINGTSDEQVFLGTYGNIGAIACVVNSTGAWNDLYINTVDGGTGGTVRLPSSVLINGGQAIHAGNVSSYAMKYGGAPGVDLNTLTTAGVYRINNTEANRPNDWGQLLVMYGGSDTITQIYGHYVDGTLKTRSGNPSNVGGTGSWSPWRTLLSDHNYSSYALPLTGGTITGTLTIGATGGFDMATNDVYASMRVIRNYKNTSADGMYIGYGNANSGRTRIFGEGSTAGFVYPDANGTWIRSDGAVYLHSSNYNSYALPLTGGALTGTISIDTSGSTALTSSVIIKRSGQSALNFGSYQGAWRSTLQIQSNANDRMLFLAPPEADYQFGTLRSVNGGLKIDVGGNTGNTGTNAVTIDTAGTANFPVGLQQGGNQVLHASNYGSYIIPLVNYTTVADASGYTWVRIPYASGGDGFNAGQQQVEFYVSRAINDNGGSPYGGCTAKFVFQSREWHSGQEMVTVQYGEHGSGNSLGAATFITHVRVADQAGSGYWIYLRLKTNTTGTGITYKFRDSAIGGIGLNINDIQSTTDPGSSTALYYGFNLISTGNEARYYRSGNQVLDAGNYNSYVLAASGTAASLSIGGNAATATTLLNPRTINGTSFNGSADIKTTEWLHSARDFPSGTIINTDIDYPLGDGDPWVLEIKGNSYGALIPFDIQYQGYNYTNTVINHGGYSNGTNITGLVVLSVSGKMTFWFPNQAYWQGFNVKVYVAYANNYTNRNVNRTTSIVGGAKPTGTNEVALSANIRQSLHSGNYSSYALPLSGGTLTGQTVITQGISIRFPHANQVDTNDGAIGSGIFGTGLNIVGVQTVAGAGRVVRVWGSLLKDTGEAYLHAANYSSYALPLSGGTVTGQLVVSATTDPAILLSGGASADGTTHLYTSIGGVGKVRIQRNGIIAGLGLSIKSGTDVNGATEVFSVTNAGAITGASAAISGAITQGGNQVIHAGNFATYGVLRSLGYANSSNVNWNTLGNVENTTLAITQETFNVSPGTGNSNYPTNASYKYGVLLNVGGGAASGRAQVYISHNGNDLIFRGGWGDSSWQTWNKCLTDQNYSNYALPISGGTLTGNLALSAATLLNIGQQARIQFSYSNLQTVDSGSDRAGWLWNSYYDWSGTPSYKFWSTNSQGASMLHMSPTQLTFYTKAGPSTQGSAFTWDVGNAVLHAGNYSSYALPLSGGTLSGNLTINGHLTSGAGYQLKWSDGSASAPGYSFYADLDTGIHRSADNTLAIVTGGSIRATFDSGGNAGFGGTPYFKIHSYGIIGASDALYNGSGGAGGTLIAALLNNDGTSPGLDLRRWTGSASTHGTTYICTDSTGKTYFYNGQQSTNTKATALRMTLDTAGNLNPVGSVTATSFSGAGTGLTGTAASLTAGAVPWSGITSKPTTFSGYGISDIAYGSTGSRNVWTITDWNQTTYGNAHFLSSENSHTNGPSSDFIYGLQTAFHRSGAAYRTQMVTELYSSPVSIWVRNSRDSDVWTSWSKLLHSNNYNSYVLSASGTAASLSIGGSAAQLNGQAASYYENRDTTAVGFSGGTLTLTRAAGNLSVSLDGRYLTGNQTITLGGDLSGSGTTSISATIGANAVTTTKINNSAVTYAKIQNVSAASVLGNSSASVSQAPQEISFTSLNTLLSGTAKAWVTFNENPTTGAITVNANFGISSVTRLSLGVYQVNFSSAFTDANYAVSGIIGYEDIGAYTNGGYLAMPRITSPKTTTYCQVCASYGGANYNARYVHVVFHR